MITCSKFKYYLQITKLMRNRFVLFVCFFLFFCLKTQAQIDVIAEKAYKVDTLKNESFFLDLSLLFLISDNEMNEHIDFDIMNSVRARYLVKKSDIEVIARQYFENQDDGSLYKKHFFMLTSGIYKYRPITKKRVVVRTMYPEPLFIFQNNTDRGLHHRFQTGMLLHPWSIILPKIKLNLGIGAVYDWSSWNVNNAKKIAAMPSKIQEKIHFINSRVHLKRNKFQRHSEWRPMLLLNLDYQITDYLQFILGSLYQHSLRSPYNKEIRDRYPDLGKVYPYILSHFEVITKVHKGILLKFVIEVDYENSNLSLYDSSWEYSMLFGLSWQLKR